MAEEITTAGAQRHRAITRVTLVGALVNLLLSIAKIFGGIVAHSQALIADGIHSLSDLFSDALVVLASRHANRAADADHPYGHGRIETAVTVALGAVLILVAIGIAWDAVGRLFKPEALQTPQALALWVALASVLSKEALYHYTLRVGRKVRSNLVRANAWHHRTDAISSLVVIVGVGGAMAGLPYLDAVAAVIVAVMIAKVGWDLGWRSVRELVDSALEPEEVDAIRRAILRVDGVLALHELRTRRMGSEALVDVHVLVEPYLSVSEGHYVSEAVHWQVVREIDHVSEVMVHIDPEDDMERSPSRHLPSRQRIVASLRGCWSDLPQSEAIERITLHYLDGAIDVEVTLAAQPMEAEASWAALEEELRRKAHDVTAVRRIDLLLRASGAPE